ncbi:unnamed protein product [Lactuca saligna]|uniref:Uncharacterized protein n=1 Tax=Lactuca saligna TaxID=75948 RepID=A0AA35Z9U9_LACSI|nr:unnamed protein product [Lactuca saligna]
MAPTVKRGKIKAQVYNEVSDIVASIAIKIVETLGFIKKNPVITTNNNDNDGSDGDDGGGESPPPPNNTEFRSISDIPMAPSIKRGKIKSQVYNDISGVVASFATKTVETFAFIRNTTTTTTGDNNNDGGDGDPNGGGSSPPPNNNNNSP